LEVVLVLLLPLVLVWLWLWLWLWLLLELLGMGLRLRKHMGLGEGLLLLLLLLCLLVGLALLSGASKPVERSGKCWWSKQFVGEIAHPIASRVAVYVHLGGQVHAVAIVLLVAMLWRRRYRLRLGDFGG
jgi:hypothetical protein